MSELWTGLFPGLVQGLDYRGQSWNENRTGTQNIPERIENRSVNSTGTDIVPERIPDHRSSQKNGSV